MYRVTVITDRTEYPLHEPRDNDGLLQLLEPVITLEVGMNGNFTFGVLPTHPNRDKLQVLKSEILVYDGEEIIFAGRIISDESNFYNVGQVTCEGELAYLLDSVQRPYSYTGNGAGLFRQLLEVHNSQVEEKKRFEVGNVTVPDTTPELNRVSGKCMDTLESMKSQLVDVNGGYLRVRRSDGRRYLDYVSNYGGTNSQVIRFGENMLDLTKYVKPAGIITALIPYGAASGDEDGGDRPLDITGVNGGKDYISDDAAINAYGWIWGTQTFDDITDPATLKQKATDYLKECIVMPTTLELTALDLGLIDVNIQKLKVGGWTNVESAPHGITKMFMLSKKVIHLDDPGKDEVILGQTQKTFTGAASKEQMKISERIDQVESATTKELNRKIENATQLITGGRGGYVVTDVYDPDTGEKTTPWRILIMDTPEKETAKNVIQINRNGFGFSRTGINGPYTNAWTIDGNLVADFVTSGTMLADRIRGGVMELGGTGLGRDGVLYIKDAAGETIGQFDKNGITINRGTINITAGSIDIGDGTFTVDSDGVMKLNGTNNTTSIGCNVLSANSVHVNYGLEVEGTASVQDLNCSELFCGGTMSCKKLDCVNDIDCSYLNCNKDITCNSIYSKTAGQSWSDRNLKQDIKSISPQLAAEIVDGLKPVSFRLKDSGEQGVGFIAQDVLELERELGISLPLTGKNGGFYTIPYEHYIAILTAAVQAMQAKLRELKKK